MSPNNKLNDFELLVLLKEGKESALDWIYKKYWKCLYENAYSVLKDGQACEDIIQEIFLKLWTKRETLEIKTSLSAYLHASVRYEVYRQLKSLHVREDIFDQIHERIQASRKYNDLEYKEFHSQICALVEQLPDKCRNVYKLSRESQLSHKEIALHLQISTKTVENHLTKALGFLRRSLGQVFTLELMTVLFIRWI